MGYTDPDQQRSIGRAKNRALVRLQELHPEEYARLYEEEMRIEGYERAPRGKHDRGGKGALIWKRITDRQLLLWLRLKGGLRDG